jgi:hypothetical protein
MLIEEVAHEFGNFVCGFVEHEMATIQNMYFSFWQFFVGSGYIEHRIVLAPNNQRWRTAFA